MDFYLKILGNELVVIMVTFANDYFRWRCVVAVASLFFSNSI